MPTFTLHRGDCLAVMREMPDNSVDSVCTDPPYGLRFMNHKWDYDVPNVDVWREALRVLKPGGYLLSFSGTRTYHRMVTAIEDGGFEIRDQIMWVYGSGFPKSLDISKALDKAAGAEREIIGRRTDRAATPKQDIRGGKLMSGVNGGIDCSAITAPATEAAKQWHGFGTALKPSHEPICVARKPLSEKTVAANVLKHGVGGINIDGCRIELQGSVDAAAFENNHRVTERLPIEFADHKLGMHDGGWMQKVGEAVIPPGRWPANLMHDGSDEVVLAFPNAVGQAGNLVGHKTDRLSKGKYGNMAPASDFLKRGDTGSAARFFYCGKASRKDREEGNGHPTVKPTSVCQWLLRLVTPPGGTTLDMYCGSGSFGKAAMPEGFNFIGIDSDTDDEGNSLGYLDIARSRISAAQALAFDREMGEAEL